MKRYIIQTKPRILFLLTLTGVIGYLIPSLSDVQFLDVLLFTIFGVLSAAGGLTINNVIDRDIDEKMVRTANRPSVGEEAIPAKNLLIFGIAISLIGFAGGFFVFGFFTFFHLAFGNLFYLFGYSLYLKRKSIWNTILGGLASPAPVWAAYAARYEMGSLGDQITFLGVNLEGWLLGGLVFVWTPSHTWAMATKNYEDYMATNMPMLPVIIGIPRTAFFTLISGLITVIYGTWVAWEISSRPLVLLAMIPHNLYFIEGLWRFYRSQSIETGTRSFKIH
ncbi:MAG: UbiA family prenyltransferase, partial [Candidatus Kariarchaeaceae archaeon]